MPHTHGMTSDGIHIVRYANEATLPDVSSLRTKITTEERILIDMRAYYHLPLSEFVQQLKHTMVNREHRAAPVAIIVHPAIVQVLGALTKTLVDRHSIEIFTDENKALQWLRL